MANKLIQNARPFYPRDTVNESFDDLVNNLARAISLGNYQKQKNVLKYLLLDLRNRQFECKQGYLYCSRDNNSYLYYRELNPFKSLGVNVKPLLALLDKLKAYGLIKEYLGFRDKASFMTRLQVNPGLQEYLDQIPESLVKDIPGVAQEIVLRKKKWITVKKKGKKPKKIAKKYPISFLETDITKWMKSEIRNFNQVFEQSHIDILQPRYNEHFQSMTLENGFTETEVNVNLNRKYIHRIFNDNFENGGRFYGAWWQSLPGDLRKYILIDNQATIELDYGGFHIALLYAIEGIDYFKEDQNRDSYYVEGWDRDDVKLLLQIVLNTSEKNAIPAYNEAREEEGKDPIPSVKLKKLILAFEKMHMPIRGYFYKGWGITLQNIDAKIAANVMMSCMMLNRRQFEVIVVLPIHDSFIVQQRHEDMLRRYMHIAISESITNLDILEGKKLQQYIPKIKKSPIVNKRDFVTDINLIERGRIFERKGILPELKFLRRFNKNKTKDVYQLDKSYN